MIHLYIRWCNKGNCKTYCSEKKGYRMKLTLEIRKKCRFFWLQAIRKARIDKCCAKCFIGDLFNEVYENTRYQEKAFVKLNIDPDSRVKAYYLCGLSKGFQYEENTHIAFVPCEGQDISIENDKIRLVITDARQIDFKDYKPNPEGDFTDKQRACRNWIFANYLLDGMPL